MHRGGIADKVGNRFEARWLTLQLLKLLDGSAQSVTIETIGDDDQGFEFSVTKGSMNEWHQCKRQTATGDWTISRLASEGVIDTFRAKIAVTGNRCIFVSTDPAKGMTSLKDKLPATQTPDQLVASLSKTETRHWTTLRQTLGNNDLHAYNFLAASDFFTLQETVLTDMLRNRLSQSFGGDPKRIEAQFRGWLEDDRNFNRQLKFDDVVSFVKDSNIEIKEYVLDRALPHRIKDATTGYLESFRAIGAGRVRINRPEARHVLDAIDKGARTVLITGPAGIGKSAIVADMIAQLTERGVLHLAIRIDQLEMVSTLDDLGGQLVGTYDSPLVILEQLSANHAAVLIVDQADAVSEASGRIGPLRRVLLELLRKSKHYRNVRLVLVCRRFDLDNDHTYREIAEADGVARIDIAPLVQEQVERELTRLRVQYDPNDPKLMGLLTMPVGLALAAELAEIGSTDLRRIEHLSQLYERLLILRDREIQTTNRPGWTVFQPLTALADRMSERHELVADIATLDSFPSAVETLQRIGLILVRGQRIGLIHESLFDHLHARAFVAQRHMLVDWLLASEQTLFRRTQVRQILAHLRDVHRARYLSDLSSILLDSGVRPHIRNTIVCWLATIVDPTHSEWQLVARYAGNEEVPIKAGPVIFGRQPWFELLQANRILESWLGTEGDGLNWALNFLRSVAPISARSVATLVDGFLLDRPDKLGIVLNAFQYVDPKTEARPIAQALLDAFERTGLGNHVHALGDRDEHWTSWVKDAPETAARIYGAQLRLWFRVNLEGHPFGHRYNVGSTAVYWLIELAKQVPLALLEQLLPCMRLAMERCQDGDTRPATDRIWAWRPFDQTENKPVDLLHVVRSALAAASRIDPNAVARLLRSIAPDAHLTSLHLLLESVQENPVALRDLLLENLNNAGLFEAGWQGAPAHSAGCAMAAVMPLLSEAERYRIEAAIFELHAEIAAARAILVRSRQESTETQRSRESWRWALDYLNDSGRRQWSVLRQIDASLLSSRALTRLAELDRKFRGRTTEEPSGMSCGWVGSPIEAEQTWLMSDDAWLSAIIAYSRPRTEMRFRGDVLVGGAFQLSRELEKRAQDNPDRFARLLSRLPKDAHQDFPNAVIAGIAATKPDSAMVERILAVAEANPAARADDLSVIRLIGTQAADMGPRAERYLLDVAESYDDTSGIGESNRQGDEHEPAWKRVHSRGSELHSMAINSARGAALEALGKVCWKSAAVFNRLRPSLDPLVGRSSAVHVLWAMNGLLMSALKHEGKQSIDWILRTAYACPEALYGSNGLRLVDWVADLDACAHKQLTALYLTQDDVVARAFAAMLVFRRCLIDPTWQSQAEDLIARGAEYRSAAAALAAASIGDMRFGTICTRWLVRFFDDDDDGVRREAADCFRNLDNSSIPTHVELFRAYASSRHFEGESTYFLYRLKHAPPMLDDLVLDLVEKTMRSHGGQEFRPRGYPLREVGQIVLKLYAGGMDHPTRRARCLDLIDQLVDRGLMDIEVLEAI